MTINHLFIDFKSSPVSIEEEISQSLVIIAEISRDSIHNESQGDHISHIE